MKQYLRKLQLLSRTEDGATAVEITLSLFAFMVVLLGSIELASVTWARISLNYAISESARYAYVHSSTITEQSLQSYASTLLPSKGGLKATFTASITPKTSVNITGQLQYSYIMLPKIKLNLTSHVLQPLPPS